MLACSDSVWSDCVHGIIGRPLIDRCRRHFSSRQRYLWLTHTLHLEAVVNKCLPMKPNVIFRVGDRTLRRFCQIQDGQSSSQLLQTSNASRILMFFTIWTSSRAYIYFKIVVMEYVIYYDRADRAIFTYILSCIRMSLIQLL